ncbi:hypothetical protein P119_gp37 [Pelagibacter phage HTVC119P]|uniref:Uncharacterized protein n=1 Tax=Pelagibacter phage HTVC119P TaxID=2283020 RepID=A0AC59HC92_9CAUD|nr:hypothetical protein P119_gp37 [Pelagibacter phage HTVC119P]
MPVPPTYRPPPKYKSLKRLVAFPKSIALSLAEPSELQGLIHLY